MNYFVNKICKMNFLHERVFYALFFITPFISFNAYSVISVELGPAPTYLWINTSGTAQLNGAVESFSSLGNDTTYYGQEYASYRLFYNTTKFPTYPIPFDYGYWAGHSIIDCRGKLTSQAQARQWAINFMNTVNHYPLAGDLTMYQITGAHVAEFSVLCADPINKTVYSAHLSVSSEFKIINPPSNNSVCSLDNQNLNIEFTSNELNTDGLSNNTVLLIKCTSGIATNYKLKLNSATQNNGRLDFGNGVLAQIYIDGTSLDANGNGILLNGLNSDRSVSVSATLMGSAATSGVSNTLGILVLEAL